MVLLKNTTKLDLWSSWRRTMCFHRPRNLPSMLVLLIIVILGFPAAIKPVSSHLLRPSTSIGLELDGEPETQSDAKNDDKYSDGKELRQSIRRLATCDTQRCGMTWEDADSSCKTGCDRTLGWAGNPACAMGEYCWGDEASAPLSCTPCTSSTCSYCGNGNTGSGICENPAYCCSRWGHCGTGNSYCKRTGFTLCGNGNRGTYGLCADTNQCCSDAGYCGAPDTCGCGGNSPLSPAPVSPTPFPTKQPVVTLSPTKSPSEQPDTLLPTNFPTKQPVVTLSPTKSPSEQPDTSLPTNTPGTVPPTNPSPAQPCISSRCGTSWTDANGKCGTPCPSATDAECPSGEYCFADVSISLPCCGSSPSTPTPVPAPAPSTCTSTRCGAGWFDADTKCGTNCISNAECTVPGEYCYANVNTNLVCCSNSGPTTPAPSPSPVTTAPIAPTSYTGENSRLIAFSGNWERCPTMAEVANYTHIMVAFAVSYTWSGGPVCNPTCFIPEPPTCANAVNTALIQQWKNAGKKVILSFGGANMGGSWNAPGSGCWEYCFDKSSYVVSRLTSIATSHGYDGIDIDYEYFYNTAAATQFLTDITLGLKNSLPAGSLVTHAPMDSDVVQGTGYYNLLKPLAAANKLDFLMPQYYNGVSFPKTNFAGTLLHYQILTNDMFGGDPTRVVFGFCVSQCGQYNTNGVEAAGIMQTLGQTYSCNGGAFFWYFMDDQVTNPWSSPVKSVIEAQAVTCP